LADYGIKYDSELVIDLPAIKCAEPTRQAVHRILGRNPDAFTAIATHQFSMTYGILQALKELGQRVPEDIAVVGAETYLNPDLAYVTHTVQDFETMGGKAVELMLSDDSRQSMKRHVLLPPKFVIGDSCGAKSPGSSRRPGRVSLTRTGKEVEPTVVEES
jgi:DNA-binding LacI/PurR family transcriptional regulator